MSCKKITCVLPPGEGAKLVQALAREKGISSTTVSSGRGFSERSDIIREVDIVILVVEDDRADDVFDFIYAELGYGQNRGRLMFQSALMASSDCAIITQEDLSAAIPDPPTPSL